MLFCVVLRLDVVRTNLGLLLHADEFGQTVVHLLDGLVFSQAHAALVRDVVDATLGLGVLASGSAHLFPSNALGQTCPNFGGNNLVSKLESASRKRVIDQSEKKPIS